MREFDLGCIKAVVALDYRTKLSFCEIVVGKLLNVFLGYYILDNSGIKAVDEIGGYKGRNINVLCKNDSLELFSCKYIVEIVKKRVLDEYFNDYVVLHKVGDDFGVSRCRCKEVGIVKHALEDSVIIYYFVDDILVFYKDFDLGARNEIVFRLEELFYVLGGHKILNLDGTLVDQCFDGTGLQGSLKLCGSEDVHERVYGISVDNTGKVNTFEKLLELSFDENILDLLGGERGYYIVDVDSLQKVIHVYDAYNIFL